MKALTLTQPWATLVAYGFKTIETRSWSTHYRGPLLIHAAKNCPTAVQEMAFNEPPFYLALGAIGVDHAGDLPRGVILAQARLVGCYLIGMNGVGWPGPQDQRERSFGDYAAGRYMWVLRAIERLPRPIPAKGALGLWEYQE